MIMTKLRGGLSNQMFQYAAARRLAAQHETEVLIDASWYDHIPPGATVRRYELDRLCITGEMASAWDVIGTDGVRNTSLSRVPVALFRKLKPKFAFVSESSFEFDASILELPDNVCLFGYWVSERYFQDAADIIRQEFRFRDPPSGRNAEISERLANLESVAVHVRRGDYVADARVNSIHGVCGPDYYEKAAALVGERVDNPHFFVFSDDLDWAAQNLRLGDRVTYVRENSGARSYEDLRLMTCAHHNIIANSGFSWWGAWLNANRDKVVVAPSRWMNDPSIDTSDVLPTSWVAI